MDEGEELDIKHEMEEQWYEGKEKWERENKGGKYLGK